MKTALLIDGGVVRVKLRSRLRKALIAAGLPSTRRDGTLKQIYELIKSRDYADTVVQLANRCIAPPEILHRVFYYDCPAFDDEGKSKLHPHPLAANINIVTKREQKHQSEFLNYLRVAEYFAVRLGELSFDGWAPLDHALEDVMKTNRPFVVSDFKPLLRQKGVDLKIGVDITLMAKERVVDRLVVLSSDSDLVPALKVARREGLQVVLAAPQTNLKRLLREHVDIYRPVTI